MFAAERVGAGEVLVVWGGNIIDGERVGKLSAAERRLTLQVEEDSYLISTTDGPGDWVNHACAPNAGLRGQIVLVALRIIEPAEEVCYDYAMSEGSSYDEFPCNCGAVDCRGRVTAHDWQVPELQHRYAGSFSPYLERRIRMRTSLPGDA